MAELNLKQIVDKLNTEFTGDTRKLVFWYDEKGEFAEDIDGILSDDEIDMIRDLYWNDMSIREFAKKKETAKSTILSKRDRVLAKLRKVLENE